MAASVAAKRNPLATGFYTVSEAARLIENARSRRIYGWLKGYEDRDAGPLLARDYTPILDAQELSFLDLIEVRFVEHFRERGVKVRALRKAAQKLRQEFKTPHPFATDEVYLVADEADVFMEVMRESAKEAHDTALLSLTTDNFVMRGLIEKHLVPGLVFDRKTHLSREWKPRADRFPDIVIIPSVAYGQPAGPSGVPTATIYNAWIAEDKNADAVARWFNIKPKEVKSAVGFEELLDQQLKQAA